LGRIVAHLLIKAQVRVHDLNIQSDIRLLYNILEFYVGTLTGTGRWKVSAKIQQLLNTLKRPKRRPLPEFYEDDDIEFEIAAKNKDPNAPKPEGICPFYIY
jgi:hypothetical protein